ncbi:MAG: hypothetical protein M3P12_09325 [Gemmatimonadota bacterium]|nr:hypothetical protein [Gemmatimonadota bacterium]
MLVGLVLGSIAYSLPAGAQQGASVSLTHTVSVTVPPRVKVQVASLAMSAAPVPANVSSRHVNPGGLSLSINASQAWVLAIGSGSSSSALKSRLQWSTNETSDFTKMTAAGVAVASGTTGYEAKAATVFFRTGSSASKSTVAGGADAEPIILTITAP